MPAYIVTLLDAARGVRLVDSCAVFAENATAAKEICKARFDGDAGAAWDAATAVEIAAAPIGTATNMLGWTLRVGVLDSDPVLDVSVLGAGTDDTIDELAALMVIALNATSIIANASYTAQTLTIAAIADALGDKQVIVEIIPPAATHPGQDPQTDQIVAIVDEGIAAAALTVQFQLDTYSLPVIYDQFNTAKA